MTRASLAFALVVTFASALPAAAQGGVDPARTPDAAFVAKAADVMSVDIELATLAASRATAVRVKALAKRVIEARTALARDLDAMTGPRQIPTSPASAPTVSAAVAPPAATAATALRALPPGLFDAAFLTALVANGEAAVSLFDAESRDGRDDEIKEWAARQLPALRDHLTAIRSLRPRPGS
jgi:putative membrane protein